MNSHASSAKALPGPEGLSDSWFTPEERKDFEARLTKLNKDILQWKASMLSRAAKPVGSVSPHSPTPFTGDTPQAGMQQLAEFPEDAPQAAMHQWTDFPEDAPQDGSQPLPSFTEDAHELGMRQLNDACAAKNPGTQFSSAAESFHRAYCEKTEAMARGEAILHCGISIWLGVLAFFRGGRTAIKSPRCGAPEELLLMLVFKSEDSGGLTGSRIRRAVDIRDRSRLRQCLNAAMFCFEQAAGLRCAGQGLLWQVCLQRSLGNFCKCRTIAATAGTRMSPEEKQQRDAYVNEIESYQSDLDRLALAECAESLPPEQWLNDQTLDSMSSFCGMFKDAPRFGLAA